MTNGIGYNQRVFLSYSRADSSFAGRLEADLEANEISVWRDVKSVSAGDSITRAIEGALKNCTAIVLLMTPHAIASHWVEREYRAALSLQKLNPEHTPRILPCVVANCEVPVFLEDILYADFRDDYSVGFTVLAGGLGVDEPRMPSVKLRDDIESLLSKIVAGCEVVSESRKGSIPTVELFELWAPLEDELRRVSAVDLSIKRRRLIEQSMWEISGGTETGEPWIDDEPFSRSHFIHSVATITQQTMHLAERYGIDTGRTSLLEQTFWSIGGSPASD